MPHFFITNKQAKAYFYPKSGNLLGWQVREGQAWENLLYQGSSERRSGIPILFPFANPLKDDIFELSGQTMPQHGFGRLFPWKWQKLTASCARMTLTNKDLSPQMQTAYPFSFLVQITVWLKGKSLFYELKVCSRSRQKMPICPGLHPYFPLLHEQKSELKIQGLEGFKAQNFPWEEMMNGDFFPFSGKAQIIFPDKKISLREISKQKSGQSGGQKWFENLVIWSQPKLKNEEKHSQKNKEKVETKLVNQDYNFVCVEPFTRATNALNENPIWLKNGQAWATTLVFDYTP